MMMNIDHEARRLLFLDLLTGAAAAHGVYEAEVLGGVHHEEWAHWYAQHMADALAAASYTIARVS
ncbi:hypothetical protein [Microbacterium sp. A84]|uniref:hypothetical protein n=1 Tax=Microbacterium sp. A84 TaxID=3450715 RepID=UPI003F429B42